MPGGVSGLGIAAGQQDGQVDLDRVGVLELVQQQVAVTLAERGPHRRAVIPVAQKLPGPHQQVVVFEPPRDPALLHRVQGEDGQPGRQVLQRGLVGGFDQVAGLLGEVLQPLVGLGLVDRAGPVRRRAAIAEFLPAQVPDGFQPVDLVAGREPLQVGLQLADPQAERVVGVGAVVTQRQRFGQRGPHRLGVGGRRGRGVGRDTGLNQIPVVVELDGQPAQMVQPHPARLQHQQQPARVEVLQQSLDETLPALLHLDPGADLVQHLHPGREASLHRVLAQDAQGEGVEGADRGPVQLMQGGGGRGLVRVAGVGLDRLQAAADAVPQLGGRLLGEGDGHDALHGRPGPDQQLDPVDQGPGLARPGPGLHEQGAVPLGGDHVPDGLVGQ